MSNVERSEETATTVVSEVAREVTQDTRIRNLAISVVQLGFRYQFERERGIPRREIADLIAEALKDRGGSNS